MTLPAKDVASLLPLIGPNRKVLPLLSTGFPWNPYHVDMAPRMVKWEILESIASGAKGFGFWGCCPIDAKEMQEISEAIRQLYPLQDIIQKGHPINSIEDLTHSVFVKGVEYENNALILVSEYSKKGKRGNIKYNVESEMSVIDLPSGNVVSRISPGNSNFHVELDEHRARLFAIRPIIVPPSGEN